jgi:Zn finger protein HypA/HybF involved in hydrogenase expression
LVETLEIEREFTIFMKDRFNDVCETARRRFDELRKLKEEIETLRKDAELLIDENRNQFEGMIKLSADNAELKEQVTSLTIQRDLARAADLFQCPECGKRSEVNRRRCELCGDVIYKNNKGAVCAHCMGKYFGEDVENG